MKSILMISCLLCLSSCHQETAEEKRVRFWRELAEKEATYWREHPAPPPRVLTPEERMEMSVQRTENMVRDIESRQQAMEREMEWKEATRDWHIH